MHPSPKINGQVTLKGICNTNLDSKICQNVPLTIGNFKTVWNFAIADIQDVVILGLDFLENNKVNINLQDFSISIGTCTVNIESVTNNNKEKIDILRVQIKKKVVIPPRSGMYTEIQFNKQPEFDIVISPYKNLNGLLSPNCVNKFDQNFVLLKNPTEKFITLKKDTDVGIGIQLDINIENEDSNFKDTKEQVDIRSIEVDHITLDQIKKCIPEFLKDMFENSIQNLTEEQSVVFAKFIISFQDVFAKNDFDMGSFNGNIQHRIDTGDAKPIRQKLRRTPLCFEKEEKEHLDQMLQKGIIETSSSDWASSPVLVRKKDGSLRYCIDFRALNKITTKDAFPLPNMSDCLESLKGSNFLSTLDMQAAYWNITVHKDDKHKTAFITKYGLFEHNRLPFGLCNSPATFSRVIQLVLQGLTWTECLAY